MREGVVFARTIGALFVATDDVVAWNACVIVFCFAAWSGVVSRLRLCVLLLIGFVLELHFLDVNIVVSGGCRLCSNCACHT